MKAILINPAEKAITIIELKECNNDGCLEHLQELVGGFVEERRLSNGEFLFVNETGQLRRLPFFRHSKTSALVYGPAVQVGPPDIEGNLRSVRSDIEDVENMIDWA